jgi:lysozyme
MKGVDVSKHQGRIDWKKVADSGVEFVIIRAGYGKNNVDKYFIENIVGAHTAGLKVGVYWFIYALNEQDALENAKKFHQTIEPYRAAITMRVWADYEGDSDNYSRKEGVVQNNSTRTRIVRTFLNYLKAKGWEVGNYANPDYIKNKFEDLSEYPLWLAWYDVSPEKAKAYNPVIFQYSSKGTVPGIIGPCDMNISFEESKEDVEPEYYPIPEFTLTDHLKKIGVDSSFNNRKKIALKNNIGNPYTGTKEQNEEMLEILISGKLIKP